MAISLNKFDELDQWPILMHCRMVDEMLYELILLLIDVVNVRLFVVLRLLYLNFDEYD